MNMFHVKHTVSSLSSYPKKIEPVSPFIWHFLYSLVRLVVLTADEISYLREGASGYGITLGRDALDLFNRYHTLLSSWHVLMNLVSHRDMKRLVPYHFLDSLKLASCYDFSLARVALDFGSGAGFPGIPLSLAFPSLETYLIDSRDKRCRFLDAAVESLGIHAHVIRSRVENLPLSFSRQFDCVLTRGTVSLKTFFLLCERFISSGGVLAAVKGDDIMEELDELRTTCNMSVFNITSTVPPFVHGVRSGNIITITRQ